MGNPTVREIVQQYLKANGYDGLVIDECGCETDQLVLCDNMSEHCEAAYREQCSDDCSCEAAGLGWHMTDRKPPEQSEKPPMRCPKCNSPRIIIDTDGWHCVYCGKTVS